MAQAGRHAPTQPSSTPGQASRQDPYGWWQILWDALSQKQRPGDGGQARDDDWAQVLVQTRRRDIPALLNLGLLPVHMHATGALGSRPVSYVSCLVETKSLCALLAEAGKPNSFILRCELVAPRSRRRLGVSHTAASGADSITSAPNQQDALTPESGLSQLIAGVRDVLKAKPPPPTTGARGSAAAGLVSQRCAKVEPLICVIDDRPSTHSGALAGSAGPRLGSMWHQGGEKETMQLLDAAALEWGAAMQVGPVGLGGPLTLDGAWLGRRMKPATQVRSGGSASAGEPSLQAYRRQVVQWPPPAESHGSAVLDLITGPALWTGHRPGHPLSLTHRVTSRRPPAQVHFVQLPIPTVVDTAGGSLAANVLDGIHDALDLAIPGQDVIVNISFGTHSGGHDGSSMLESAMCELLDLYDGTEAALGKTLHIVLPAGNSHRWRCHAMGRLRGDATDASARRQRLRWKIQPDTPGDSFIEVWLPDDAMLTMTLTAPDGSHSHVDISPQADGFAGHLDKAKTRLFGAMIAPTNAAQGLRGRMVLVAVSATAVPSAPFEIRFISLGSGLGPKKAPSSRSRSFQQPMAPWDWGWTYTPAAGFTGLADFTGLNADPALAPHGIWCLDLAASGAADVPFHAWIQRNDSAPLRGRTSRGYRGRQSYFLDPPDGGVDPRYTLNGIATFCHERLFVVGAMQRQDHCPSNYSAAGPGLGDTQRCEGPDLVVHADDSRALPGLLVTGFHGGARHRVSGTSMAAAVVTRHLYEHLCRGAKADSFRHWPYQSGLCDAPGIAGACQDRRAEGDPEEAHPLYRGLSRRVVPHKPDGSL